MSMYSGVKRSTGGEVQIRAGIGRLTQHPEQARRSPKPHGPWRYDCAFHHQHYLYIYEVHCFYMYIKYNIE